MLVVQALWGLGFVQGGVERRCASLVSSIDFSQEGGGPFLGGRVALSFDCFFVAWPVGPGCQRGGGPYLCRFAKHMKWTVAGPGQAPVPSGAASGTVSVAVGGLPGGS